MEQMSIKLLSEVEQETKRFLKKVKELKERIKDDKFAVHGCKETGAVRRVSLDLKNELTRITTSTAY